MQLTESRIKAEAGFNDRESQDHRRKFVAIAIATEKNAQTAAGCRNSLRVLGCYVRYSANFTAEVRTSY